MHWHFASTMFVQVVALVAILGLIELCVRRRVRPVVRYLAVGPRDSEIAAPGERCGDAGEPSPTGSSSESPAAARNTVVSPPTSSPPAEHPLPQPLVNFSPLNFSTPQYVEPPVEPPVCCEGPGHCPRHCEKCVEAAVHTKNEAASPPPGYCFASRCRRITLYAWIFSGASAVCYSVFVLRRRTLRVRTLVRRARQLC